MREHGGGVSPNAVTGVLPAESVVYDKSPSPDSGATQNACVRRDQCYRANRRRRYRVQRRADDIRSRHYLLKTTTIVAGFGLASPIASA